MTTARAFNLAFALPVGALFAALLTASLSLDLQPLEGDLTRMGGYSENDFGWRADQEAFPQVYSTFGPTYERPVDVLVVGDSFSLGHQKSTRRIDPRKPFWQNYLYRDTGLSIATLSLYELGTLDRLLDSPAFKAHPPKVVIYEIAEISLASISGGRPTLPARITPGPRHALPLRPQPVAPSRWNRTATLSPVNVDFGLTQNYLRKNLSRDWLGHNPTPVRRTRLTRDDLFSNAASGEFLLWEDHTRKQKWDRARMERIGRRLVTWQERAQAGGRTYFTTLVAPDRLTPYEDQLADPRWRGTSKLDWLYETPGLQAVRANVALEAAVRAGTPDVYLPHDTHWSSTGHRLAAEAVVRHLKEAGVLAGK